MSATRFRIARLLTACFGLVAAAGAQDPGLIPVPPGYGQDPLGSPQGPGAQPGAQRFGQQGPPQQGDPNASQTMPGGFLQGPSPEQSGLQDGFTSIWSRPNAPQFSGFPVFPVRLSGYGNYPLPVDPSTGASSVGAGAVLPLAPAGPEPEGWPAWVRLASRKPLPYAPDRGLLIANSGRVWTRSTPEDAFVPSFFHDKFSMLAVGGEVEVRQRGEFEALLHRSTRVELRGPSRLQVVALDEGNVELSLSRLTWVRLHMRERAHAVRLPDGSTLRLAAMATPTESQEPGMPPMLGPPAIPGQLPFGLPTGGATAGGLGLLFAALGGPGPLEATIARVELRRVDEPSWYGGRATLTNLGERPIVWQRALGETTIAPSQRVTFFLTPPSTPTTAELDTDGALLEADGDAVRCRAVADDGGEVRWSGARFTLPVGGAVVLDPLGGVIRQGDG